MDIIELVPETFKSFIMQDKAVVDFYAPWCGPCRSMLRELEKKAVELPDFPIGKVNIENAANQELVKLFQVSTIPAVFLFGKGQMLDHFTGYQPARLKEFCQTVNPKC